VRNGTSAQIQYDSRAAAEAGVGLGRPPHRGRWLSLRQAANEIGVHPTTLRRWAHEGRLAFYRTAGGHRRFLSRDVQVFLSQHARLRAGGGVEGAWAQEAATSIRRERPFDVGGLPLGEEDRGSFRRSGQRMLSLVREAAEDPGRISRLEQEAKRIGLSYAAWGKRHAVPPDEMLRVLFRIRQAMIGSALDLSEDESLEPQAVGRILRQVHRLLDEVEMALFSAALQPEHPGRNTV